jgi:predicted nucleotide-binding protein (sugar kinase/HSP70/actin superfamily)
VGGVVYSDYTTKKLWDEGNNWGSIDPCFPAKVAHAHVYNLMKKSDVTHICVPMVTHLGSHVTGTLGHNACVIQMGTSEVIEAAFTRERNYFADRGVGFWKPMVRMDRPEETADRLYEYFRERLGISAAENRWAVEQGFASQRRYVDDLQQAGRELLDWLVTNDRIGIVTLGHPYHHDPGLNHGLLEEFQRKGFPILCIESLPLDGEFLEPLGLDGKSGRAIHDITDVWTRCFNRNTNHKIWASKVVARHPNLAAVDLSSFKCGHDAPTYSYVDNIMDASGAPHFTFHDIDQNKPHASMKIRIQTFEYFLRLEEASLKRAVRS